jgi:hypothetical protein
MIAIRSGECPFAITKKFSFDEVFWCPIYKAMTIVNIQRLPPLLAILNLQVPASLGS